MKWIFLITNVSKILNKIDYDTLTEDNTIKFKYPMPLSKKITIASLFAMAISIKNVIYRDNLSKAARACPGVQDKRKCMNKFKKEGMLKRIELLQKGKSRCKETNDPEACRNKMDSAIKKLKEKAEKYAH